MYHEYNTGQAPPQPRTVSPWLAATFVIVGLVLFVIAQFPSETSGEPPAAWDWIRHGVCFLGGALACVGIVRGLNVWRRLSGAGAVYSVVIGLLIALFGHLVMEEYFDEGALVAGLRVWLIQHGLIFLGGMVCYVGMNRFYETRERAG